MYHIRDFNGAGEVLADVNADTIQEAADAYANAIHGEALARRQTGDIFTPYQNVIAASGKQIPNKIGRQFHVSGAARVSQWLRV